MKSLRYLPPPRNIDRVTVGDAINSFISLLATLGLNEKTLKVYRIALNSFADTIGRDRVMSSITVEDYLRWLSKIRDRSLKTKGNLGNSTAHYYSVFVRRFLKWAGLKEEIPVIPKSKSDFSDALSWDEVEKLIGAARDYIDMIAISLMVESGLRALELLSLRASDIDLVNGIVRVTGKYGKQRIVILGPLSRTILSNYIAQNSVNPGDRLINISYQALYKRLKRLAKIAGLNPDRIRPHILRHTFATEALRRGMSLPALQKLLGHSDLKITQLYLHLTGDDIRREYERVFGQQPNPWPLQPPEPYTYYPHGAPQPMNRKMTYGVQWR